MFRRIILLAISFLTITSPVSAFKAETFVTFSNPVRGYEGWTNTKQTPLDLPKYLYQEATHSAVPVTWLLRYDALDSATISAFFKDLSEVDRHQHLGAFLEITPKLVESVGIAYPDGFSIYNANRIFLSGYQDFQRKIIIDRYMEVFFERFGYYPRSVSAWHLDSVSLLYLQEKYSVLTAMNCDDQYSMDGYRLWGGYIGSPYFPHRNNSLIPARTSKERVNLAMVRWAPRDLSHFYGEGDSSMYSFQINDYLGLGLDHSYFRRLLKQYSQKNFNEFTHFNLGLENDYDLMSYKQEIKNVYRSLKSEQGEYNLRPISLSDFGDWLKARYPESSPTYFYEAIDTVDNSNDKTDWYQSPWYRLGLKSSGGRTKIIDLRIYNSEIYEDNINTPNTSTSLHHEIPAVVDTIKYKRESYELDFDLSSSVLEYNKYLDAWKATLVNGQKKIILHPDQITFVGFSPPSLNSNEIIVSKTKEGVVWTFKPHTPFRFSLNIFWIAFIIFCFYKFFKTPKPPYLGLLLCLLAGITLYRSGSLNSFGMGFWGPNGHDAIFHLSLIQSFSEDLFSLNHPQFSGVFLKDYHFVFDYLLGLISKVTFTSPLILYFLIFPILSSLVLVSLLNKLLDQWGYGRLEKNLAFIFVFLGGSLGFIPRIVSGQNILSGESAFWANQSISMFLNPPFMLSIILLLLFLTKLNRGSIVTLSLIGGVLAQTKVYAFLLLLGALLLNKKYKLFFGVFLVGLVITLPFASFSNSPFVFQPLWFTKSLFASFDRVYWPKFVQAWQTYELAGPFAKLLLVNIIAVIAFVVGNLGVRIIGFFDNSFPLVRSMIFIGIAVPLFFTQKVNPWNTIQFMYYSIFFLGIFAGKVLSRYKPLIIPVVIFATFTSIGTLRDYTTYRSASRISYAELQVLDKLRSLPRGMVLSPVFANNVVPTPKPQYAYVSSAYISALSGQPEFLSDTINLDITGIKYQERFNEIQKFYNSSDKAWAKKYLEDNNIKYVYETPLKRLNLNPADINLSLLHDSCEIKLYIYN